MRFTRCRGRGCALAAQLGTSHQTWRGERAQTETFPRRFSLVIPTRRRQPAEWILREIHLWSDEFLLFSRSHKDA